MKRWTVIGRGRAGTVLARWLGSTAERELSVGRPQGVLVAIPDDALEGFAAALAPMQASWRGWCFLHTSGARPAAVLAPLGRRGAVVGSLHPMMTFGRGRGPVSPKGLVFSVEGDAGAKRAAKALVAGWGGELIELEAKAKAAYHFAATLVGPGSVVAMAAAEGVLRRAGLRGNKLAVARGGLIQLLRATAGNMADGSTTDAWTGPIARDDGKTLALHWEIADNNALRGYYAGLVGTGRRLLP